MIMITETGHIYRVTGDSPHIVGADLNAAVGLAQQHRSRVSRLTNCGPE
jgi:hypothetical protein